MGTTAWIVLGILVVVVLFAIMLYNRLVAGRNQVEAAWQILMPVLTEWADTRARNFPNYAAGTWGPRAADDLLTRDGREWRPTG